MKTASIVKTASIAMRQLAQIYLMCAISMILLASNAHSKCIEIESAEDLVTDITTTPSLTDLRPYHYTVEATGWNEDGYSVLFESPSEPSYFEIARRILNHIVDISYWFNGKLYETHSISSSHDYETGHHTMSGMDVSIMDGDKLMIISRYDFDYDLEKHRYEGYKIYLPEDLRHPIKKKFKYEDGKTYECDAE